MMCHSYYIFLDTVFAIENIINTNAFTTTILAPVGIENTYENTIPKKKQNTDIIAEHIITFLNVFTIFIDVSAGKIIKLEISIVPIILIPTTIVIAVNIAITVLYRFVFTPVAFAKFSSKVTAKILL